MHSSVIVAFCEAPTVESLQVLQRFVDQWRERRGFALDPFGNATFRALVEYQCSDLRSKELTVVRIRRHGAERGKITLQKGPGQFPDFPHLEFFAPMNVYILDDVEHGLSVHGYSDKFAAQYTLKILPR